jgi:hypothetical protein
MHYDGAKWQLASSAPVYDLNGVFGTGPKNVFAVGATSTLIPGPGEFWRYDGVSWKSVSTKINGTLYSVWASADNDIYASGAAGLLIRGDGSVFNKVASGSTAELLFIFGVSKNLIATVGSAGTVLLGDGTGWRKVPVTSSGGYSATLFGGAFSADGGSFYAVGNSSANGNLLGGAAPYSGLSLANPGSASDLTAVVLGSNGIGWVAGKLGFLGYFDTRP